MNFEAFNIDNIQIKPNREIKNKRYDYIWWGEDNLYPQYLLELKENSPIHSVAADSTVTMCFGKGIEIEGLGNVLINKLKPYLNYTTRYYMIFIYLVVMLLR